MGGGRQVMKRIPLIQFPKRHAKSSASVSGSTSQTQDIHHISMSSSDVPAPPSNTAVGGKASLQPKRTPVSHREIEAILLGGCF
ncbi:uncharacterized protein LOC8274354 [Ricinus communis]|uniref:uncharacterized protein LOC8274354 n=1 Tax=Ricinus communis TaxID=3988 RepID=UPI00077243C6|nr:uncharacterized protein LOC8274354 [Ricinus communis]|eukprot:XP_015571200.1 uncharacterized protein LOC8274354 [Ricinus communis]